jgi:hypothetical protein
MKEARDQAKRIKQKWTQAGTERATKGLAKEKRQKQGPDGLNGHMGKEK